MKLRMRTAACMVAGALSLAGAAEAGVAGQPELTKVEKATGWHWLFNGTDGTGFHAYKQKSFPEKGWKIEDGCLHTVAGGGGGDLVSNEEFGDFELTLEFKTTPKANSGIIYHCNESRDASWQTGPEFQVLDDPGYQYEPTNIHATGALYDMKPPDKSKILKPVGEWNTARIYCRNGILQHWLNGVKVVDIRTDGPEWKEAFAKSKFKDYNDFFGPKGHIALQEHDGEVWYRNIKVRDLAAPMPGEVVLFNGKDLSGWDEILPEGGKPADVWAVKDGLIICQGNPMGYLKTQKDYTNYVIRVEWRFNPVTKKAGNSGVLVRATGPDKLWPRSVENQLESGNAGDFWNIDKFPMKTDTSRLEGRRTKKTHGGVERPIGEWNEYEIVVNHGEIIPYVNGEEMNRAWDVQEIPGRILLQSEGAEIHFRTIRLAPLD